MKKYKYMYLLVALSLVGAVAMSGCCKDYKYYSDATMEHSMNYTDMPTEGCVAFTVDLELYNTDLIYYLTYAEGKSLSDWTASCHAVADYPGCAKAQVRLAGTDITPTPTPEPDPSPCPEPDPLDDGDLQFIEIVPEIPIIPGDEPGEGDKYFDVKVIGYDYTQDLRPTYLQFSYEGLTLGKMYTIYPEGYVYIVDENGALIASLELQGFYNAAQTIAITHEHTYGEMQVLQSATADKEGIIGIACTKCGHVKDSCKLPNDALVLAKVLADLEDQIADAEEGTVIVLDLQHYHSLPASIMKHIITCGYDVELKYIYQGTHYDITIKNGKGIDCDVEWYGPLFMNHLYGETAEN